ncbi:MAG: YibE/F family protein [Candidatus Uhrbacteria bacterium]|nr:YibE/F family protein [Candidatus Uhrbacteria bacterium]
MIKRLGNFFLFFGILLSLCSAVPVFADDNTQVFLPDVYYKGAVVRALDKKSGDIVEGSTIVQNVLVRIESGSKKGIEVAAQNAILSNIQGGRALRENDKVVIVESYGIDGRSYAVVDSYRLSSLGILALIFIICVWFFGRIRGLSSLLGLTFSIGVLVFFIVPQILQGRDPFLISVVGSLIIAFVSLYLAHGFNKRTSIALLSTVITLVFSALCSVLFVTFGKLFGTGTEEALYLQIGQTESINLQGLLLGGIIIGIMGVLDDITTAQTAAVDEISKANPSLTFHELYARGLSVGKEHIASLVNTLALAYAGVSLPLFLLFIVNKGQPLWVIVNGENIAEEIVRTLVGSSALIIAVPVATFLAARWYGARKK